MPWDGNVKVRRQSVVYCVCGQSPTDIDQIDSLGPISGLGVGYTRVIDSPLRPDRTHFPLNLVSRLGLYHSSDTSARVSISGHPFAELPCQLSDRRCIRNPQPDENFCWAEPNNCRNLTQSTRSSNSLWRRLFCMRRAIECMKLSPYGFRTVLNWTI